GGGRRNERLIVLPAISLLIAGKTDSLKIKVFRKLLQSCCSNGDLLLSLLPIPLFDSFAYSRYCFYPVTGIKSRRIKRMFKPSPAGQSLPGKQDLFSLVQFPVYFSRISA